MARPKITRAYLEKRISQGYGQGFHENYKPWIEIKRWNPSPVSQHVYATQAVFTRPCHFLSRNEYLLALLFIWAGFQIREQEPIWPWAQPDPLYGLDENCDAKLKWSEGMWEICKKLNIEHGYFPGTKLPHIWTADMIVNLPVEKMSEYACHAAFVSVKPLEADTFQEIDPLNRQVEKLEAERQFSLLQNINYVLADSKDYPDTLWGNLDWLVSVAFLPKNDRRYKYLMRFLDQHGGEFHDLPPLEWRDRIKTDYSADTMDAEFVMQHLLWSEYIDIDITKKIRMKETINTGGNRFRKNIRSALLGGPQ